MNMPEVLRKIRALIAQGWCQGDAAQDVHGHALVVGSPHATAWCLVGAVNRITLNNSYKSPWNVYTLFKNALPDKDKIFGCTGLTSLIAWNDAPHRTQADVLALLDRAILAAKVNTMNMQFDDSWYHWAFSLEES